MPKNKPYRFALLSHAVLDAYLRSNLTAAGDFTLDFFPIQYEKHLFGIPYLIEREGYEAILLYSGLGLPIRNEIGNSVALIAKTDMDIIKALLSAREISREVVLAIHVSENVDTPLLEKLLKMKINVAYYDDIQDLQAKLKVFYEHGQKVFLGGGLSEAAAAFYNARFFRIMPNSHSIKQAIEHAKGLAKARREEQNSKAQLVAMLRIFREGVICVDEEGSLIFYNNSSIELLKISKNKNREDALTKQYAQLMIFDVLQDETPREDIIMSIGGEQLVVTTMPVSLYSGMRGAVAFINDVNTVRTLSGKLREGRHLSGFIAHNNVDDLKGASPAICRIRNMIQYYAPHTASVFIHGETGTGKEVVAQALHNAGPRKEEPFVAINCAALPDSLLESELFGYDEGAFTGAKKGGKPGVFEMSHNGTLFLDEVGDMGANAQLRLLRVLETRELIRIGGNRVIPVDIRVVSASNESLIELVSQGRFRKDLFYRLAMLRLYIPPLRERMSDLPLLLENLFTRYNARLGSISKSMMHAVHAYAWPGNIRELLAFMESYLILLGNKNHDESLFIDLLNDWAYVESKNTVPEIQNNNNAMKTNLKHIALGTRRKAVQEAVRQCGGNKRQAASHLGISYNTLWRILHEKE